MFVFFYLRRNFFLCVSKVQGLLLGNHVFFWREGTAIQRLKRKATDSLVFSNCRGKGEGRSGTVTGRWHVSSGTILLWPRLRDHWCRDLPAAVGALGA